MSREAAWSLLRRAVFGISRFVGAETAHRLGVFFIRLLGAVGPAPLRWISGARAPAEIPDRPTVFGVEFLSRVGLAAGFDKDAEIFHALPALGFGFAEIGTVTPRAQPGNDRPRLFRDPEGRALFNRMGFNNRGACEIAAHLQKKRHLLPEGFRIGVNVGKNRDTPLEAAAQDYVEALRAFKGLADYLVVNVSSPNTPGLRALQSAKDLRPILLSAAEELSKWRLRPPLLVKIAPELAPTGALAALMGEVEPWGAVQGWVLTNTLGGNYPRNSPDGAWGGWSGEPLALLARESLKEARKLTRLPIISVGGVMSVEEAESRRELGADLVQIYTGWVYGGPSFPALLSAALARKDAKKG